MNADLTPAHLKPRKAREKVFRDLAVQQFHRPGEIEVRHNAGNNDLAEVSLRGDGKSAWVQAWVLVVEDSRPAADQTHAPGASLSKGEEAGKELDEATKEIAAAQETARQAGMGQKPAR